MRARGFHRNAAQRSIEGDALRLRRREEAPRAPQLEGVAPRRMEAVGVIGAGTMGAGISVAFADAGYRVVVVETSEAAAQAGRQRIAAPWDRQVKSGRLGADERQARSARVAVTADFSTLAPLRSDRRGGVRGHGGQAGYIRSARRDRQARRDPGDQHLLSRRRRDRRGERPARRRDRPAFLLAGQCDAPRRSGRGAGERQGRGRDGRRRRAGSSARSPSFAACATASSAIAFSPIGARSST